MIKLHFYTEIHLNITHRPLKALHQTVVLKSILNVQIARNTIIENNPLKSIQTVLLLINVSYDSLVTLLILLCPPFKNTFFYYIKILFSESSLVASAICLTTTNEPAELRKILFLIKKKWSGSCSDHL